MKPFLPGERVASNIAPLVRAVIALGRDHDAEDGKALKFIERGATFPTGTAGSGAALMPVALSDIVALIGPVSSAFGVIAKRAVVVGLKTAISEFVPSVAISPNGVTFVLPGAPAPVAMLIFDGITVTGQKVVAHLALTREMVESANAEALIRLALAESIKLAVETMFFDTVAGDEIRPAGLRNGVAAIAAASADGTLSIQNDLAAVGAAVAAVAGSLDNIIFVGDPASALTVSIALPLLKFPFLASAGLPPKTIMAVAVNALAIGGGDEIKFDVSRESAMQMSNTPAGADGAPVRSMFQTDCVAIRLTFDLSWKMRAPGGVAWTNVIW